MLILLAQMIPRRMTSALPGGLLDYRLQVLRSVRDLQASRLHQVSVSDLQGEFLRVTALRVPFLPKRRIRRRCHRLPSGSGPPRRLRGKAVVPRRVVKKARSRNNKSSSSTRNLHVVSGRGPMRGRAPLVSEGPGSEFGLVCQASAIFAERQVKLNALSLGGCDHRADPNDFSTEFWLDRNDHELALIEKNLRSYYSLPSKSCSTLSDKK